MTNLSTNNVYWLEEGGFAPNTGAEPCSSGQMKSTAQLHII